MGVGVSICLCIHVGVGVDVCLYICLCMWVWLCVYMLVYVCGVDVCLYVCMFFCLFLCMCVCACIRMCIRVYIHVYFCLYIDALAYALESIDTNSMAKHLSIYPIFPRRESSAPSTPQAVMQSPSCQGKLELVKRAENLIDKKAFLLPRGGGASLERGNLANKVSLAARGANFWLP